MLTMIDICHAIPPSFEANGKMQFSILPYTINGPQKALQSFVVELLSATGPIKYSSERFMAVVKSGNTRDVGILRSYFVNYVNEMLGYIDDPTRPDDERIASASLTNIETVSADSAILSVTLVSRDSSTFKFKLPVSL